MLNFVALHAVGYLVRGPLQEPLRIYPQTDTLPGVARLPRLIEGTRLHWGLVGAVCAAVVLWWVIRSTATGFRLRASGANPYAAWSAGLIDVRRVTAGRFRARRTLPGHDGGLPVTGRALAPFWNQPPGHGHPPISLAPS